MTTDREWDELLERWLADMARDPLMLVELAQEAAKVHERGLRSKARRAE